MFLRNDHAGLLKEESAVKKAMLIVVVGFVTVFGAYLFLSNKTLLTKNENPEQQAKKESQAVETENYSPTGAIAQAKILPEGKDFREEAREAFGLVLLSSEKEEYLQFRERLLANRELVASLQNAKKESVSVFFSHEKEFHIGTGWVDIDASTSDRKIIEFLDSSVLVAKAKDVHFQKLNREASKYGISLWSFDLERWEQVKGRLLSNEKLAFAFQAAKGAGVSVFLKNRFQVGRGWVDIDTSATDEEIIEFLLGK